MLISDFSLILQIYSVVDSFAPSRKLHFLLEIPGISQRSQEKNLFFGIKLSAYFTESFLLCFNVFCTNE